MDLSIFENLLLQPKGPTMDASTSGDHVYQNRYIVLLIIACIWLSIGLLFLSILIFNQYKNCRNKIKSEVAKDLPPTYEEATDGLPTYDDLWPEQNAGDNLNESIV